MFLRADIQHEEDLLLPAYKSEWATRWEGQGRGRAYIIETIQACWTETGQGRAGEDRACVRNSPH